MSVECYRNAEIIRRELLSASLQSTNRSISFLQSNIKRNPAVKAAEDLQMGLSRDRAGILTSRLWREADELFKIMNGKYVSLRAG
jgi:hypothetical protein